MYTERRWLKNESSSAKSWNWSMAFLFYWKRALWWC